MKIPWWYGEIFQTFKTVPRVTGPRRLAKRGVREAFMKLFTTSPMGLGIATGAGKRTANCSRIFALSC